MPFFYVCLGLVERHYVSSGSVLGLRVRASFDRLRLGSCFLEVVPVADESTSLTLQRGERRSVRLPGLGTAGYEWTHRVEGDAGAVEVSISTAPAEEIAGRPPGTSIDEIAAIHARGPGRAIVILEQRRPWETKPAPQNRRVIEVTVK